SSASSFAVLARASAVALVNTTLHAGAGGAGSAGATGAAPPAPVAPCPGPSDGPAAAGPGGRRAPPARAASRNADTPGGGDDGSPGTVGHNGTNGQIGECQDVDGCHVDPVAGGCSLQGSLCGGTGYPGCGGAGGAPGLGGAGGGSSVALFAAASTITVSG